MPLSVSESTEGAGEYEYLIFYASIDPETGKMWCPDCRDVEELVRTTFEGEEAPKALIVWVGNKLEWRAPTNPVRKEPWSVTNIPTIVKLKNGEEVARLVEAEIQEGLSTFVKI